MYEVDGGTPSTARGTRALPRSNSMHETGINDA